MSVGVMEDYKLRDLRASHTLEDYKLNDSWGGKKGKQKRKTKIEEEIVDGGQKCLRDSEGGG
jgi:hypothetical protein